MENLKKCVIPNCACAPPKRVKLVKVGPKGFSTLLGASNERGDSLQLEGNAVWIHEVCRRNYISPKSIAAYTRSRKSVSTYYDHEHKEA